MLIFEKDCKSPFGLSLSRLQQRDSLSLSFSASPSVSYIIFHLETPLLRTSPYHCKWLKGAPHVCRPPFCSDLLLCLFLPPSWTQENKTWKLAPCTFLFRYTYSPPSPCSMICRFSALKVQTVLIFSILPLILSLCLSLSIILSSFCSVLLLPPSISNDLSADSEAMKSYGISLFLYDCDDN